MKWLPRAFYAVCAASLVVCITAWITGNKWPPWITGLWVLLAADMFRASVMWYGKLVAMRKRFVSYVMSLRSQDFMQDTLWSIWIVFNGEAKEMATINDYATAWFYCTMYSQMDYYTAWIEEGASNAEGREVLGSSQRHTGAGSDCAASADLQCDSEVSHEQNTENIPAIGLG